MEVTTVSTVISVVLGVICAPCGLFLGLVPMKADLVTAYSLKAGYRHRYPAFSLAVHIR